MLKIGRLALALMVLASSSAPMLAESPEQGAVAGTPAAEVEKAPLAKGLGIVGASLGAGLAVAGGAFGIARIGAACVESIARQPEAGGAMFAPMVVAAAMVEGGMLFAILVCMLGVFRT